MTTLFIFNAEYGKLQTSLWTEIFMKAESSSAVMKYREKDEPHQPDGDVESHPMWCARRDPSV